MCYIKRKIFPCCGSENWYSEYIHSQCTGTPRCDVDNCIFVGVKPEVIETGRCWRCLLGDVKRGARLDDRVMREVMKLAERNGYGLDGKKKPKGQGKGKIEADVQSKGEIGAGGKRKREMNEEQEGERVENPRAKKLKGGYESSRGAYGGGKGKRRGSVRMRPRTPEAPKSSLQSSGTWTNNQQNPLPVQGARVYGSQTQELRLQPASQTHATSNFLQQNSMADPGYPNSEYNAGSQQNSTINPMLMKTQENQTPNRQVAWDATQWDMWLAQNSDMAPFLDENLPLEMSTGQEGMMNGHITGGALDLNSIFDQKIASLLAVPENMHQNAGQEYVSSFDNFDFQGGHDQLNAWLSAEGNAGETAALHEQPSSSASWLPMPSTIDQYSGVNQARASLSMPGNQTGASDFEMSEQFYKQFPQAASYFGSHEPSSAMNLKMRGGPSTPLGDPMRYQSDLDEQQFKKDWLKFVLERFAGADASDAETKVELEAILLGDRESKADNTERKTY